MTRLRAALALALFLGLTAPSVSAARFVAYSLKQAEKRLTTGAGTAPDLQRLGGITDPVAFVYDPRSEDFIIVGIADQRKPEIALESLAAVLRSVLRDKIPPLVSIDPARAGTDVKTQPIRFQGPIVDTRLGNEMLDADVALKRLALGKIRADVWGVSSYLSLSADHARRSGVLPKVSSLFWIEPGEILTDGNDRDGIRVIHKLPVVIHTEVFSAEGERKDEIGDVFAARVAASFPDLVLQYPALARVPPILKMIALAQGMREHPSASKKLSYWLNQYQIPKVPTPRTYELLEARQEVSEISQSVVLSGGISTDPVVLNLKSGHAGTLRDVVIESRPQPTALTWNPPLEAWNVTDEDAFIAAASGGGPGGFPVHRRLDVYPSTSVPPSVTAPRPPPPPPPAAAGPKTPPLVRVTAPAPSSTRIPTPIAGARPSVNTRTFQPWSASSRIGGVMLQGAASVTGDTTGTVDLSAGNFALVVEGARAKLSEQTFRKFVTSLWAVYYHKQDPGISIDPIAQGVPQHLVRYIGNVLYTDLGRVMREADYLMKKWAVGTERPDYRGFKSVEERWVQEGAAFTGASRRFWFVPEDMKYKQAGNMLLFESGRMTLQTQINDPQLRNVISPGDRKFADFFTEHYDEIAKKYPVLDELMDYAKLVSLAKYLKEQGVPLYWFLMANKDLVIGEDSPGVVNELVKESNLRQGLVIRGGVNLGFEGQYRFDEAALEALRQARARMPDAPARARIDQTTAKQEDSPRISRETFSFDVNKSSYSVVPQHASTSGKDRYGIRYQTDLSIQKNGHPGLELARFFDPNRATEGGDFGNGWRLLLPYRVTPPDKETRPFLNAIIPKRMELENLLNGKKEMLTFSEDRYAAAGYVPDKAAESQIIGLFITVGGFFRLADRIGNEFRFDGAGNLTDMLLGDDLRLKVEYQRGMTDAFEEAPYEVMPSGQETIQFRNAILPKRLEVRDLTHGTSEFLIFSDEGRIAGYTPVDRAKSRYEFLAILSDATLRLADKIGNETAFSAGGRFEGMIVSESRHLIKALSMGDQRVEMKYTIDPTGRAIISQAQMRDGKSNEPANVVQYIYEPDGSLASVEHKPKSVAIAAR